MKLGRLLLGLTGLLCLCWALPSRGEAADFAPLVQGVGEIVSPGVPGPVWPQSDAWAPIAGGDADTSFPSAFVIARSFGTGRVVVVGHDGILNRLDLLDNRVFALNVVEWLRGAGAKSVGYTTGHVEWLTAGPGTQLGDALGSEGYEVREIAGTMTPESLADVSVLIVGICWGSVAPEEVAAVEAFVSGGGGVLLVGLGWSWLAYHQGRTLDDFPMAQLAAPFEACWLDGDISDPTNKLDGWAVLHTFYPNVQHLTVAQAMSVIDGLHVAHPEDLPAFLSGSSEDCLTYLRAHATLAVPVRNFASGNAERESVYDFYIDLATRYPQCFGKSVVYDPGAEAFMAWARERVFATLIASKALDQGVKDEIAGAAQLFGHYGDIWDEQSVYLLDNSRLDATQLAFIYQYLSLLPAGLHDLRRISVADLLGERPSVINLDAPSAGVNIFGVAIGGYSENGFPPDSDPYWVDGFCVVVAHEVNHVVDSCNARTNEPLFERKYALIAEAAGPDVVFHPGSGGVHWAATKGLFLERGYWDGQEETWDSAWGNYWSAGPGVARNDWWLRNNLQLMCEAPQEAFATLANQYSASSEVMFDLALKRFDRGISSCINQFLYFGDVYSRGGDGTYFYTIDTEGNITRARVILLRDAAGHIVGVNAGGTGYCFEVDGEGDVVVAWSGHFPDVRGLCLGPDPPEPHWAFAEIEACFEAGIVGGYPSGVYHPDWEVDRASMAVYISRALDLVTQPYEGRFPDDVPDTQWAWPWIEALARAGIVQGFDATHYRPEDIVNRDAMAVYVARSLVGGIDVPAGPTEGTFEDVPDRDPGPVHWAYDEIEYCVAHEVVAGYDPTHYRPDEAVTRDQMAVYVARAFALGM